MGVFSSKPIVVEWAAQNPNHKLHEEPKPFGSGKIIYKTIQHEGVFLLVKAPEFDANETRVGFTASSLHEKALGFGAGGVGLNTGVRVCHPLSLAASTPVHASRRGYDDPMTNTNGGTVMVDQFQGASFDARFHATPKAARVSVVIEVKRLFAPNFMFVIPFEIE